ncbi:hypothetical protein FOL47_001012 [Perkinsus chesapeaki]|uniref:RRM domain-containing protein n=1 Tax=Perkinsus chesapeaki TaxID=330153 RepID=A0A7J6KVV6_PERCH|nr:hypothetical protein FOL47_001012 [Perkinsus chesapeaki]
MSFNTSYASAAAAGGLEGWERNPDATIYVGNLDGKVDEELLWELFVQCGPIQNVSLPRDRIVGSHQGYGFVEFKNPDDAEYAVKIMNLTKLFSKPIRCNKSSSDKIVRDEVGANLFIGNLGPDVDEKQLYDTFSAFEAGGYTVEVENLAVLLHFGSFAIRRAPEGVCCDVFATELQSTGIIPTCSAPPKGIVVFCKIMRSETGESKGFGFVSYDGFEASDAAMAGMNGQYLCNRQISVSYSYKKDSKGERHGTAAERLLAANRDNAHPHGMENEYYASVGMSAMPQAAPAPLAGSLPTPPALPPGMSAPSVRNSRGGKALFGGLKYYCFSYYEQALVGEEYGLIPDFSHLAKDDKFHCRDQWFRLKQLVDCRYYAHLQYAESESYNAKLVMSRVEDIRWCQQIKKLPMESRPEAYKKWWVAKEYRINDVWEYREPPPTQGLMGNID